jgi:hypothetical protein
VNIQYLIIGGVALLTLVTSLYRWRRRIRRASLRAERVVAASQAQSLNIRGLARQTLALRRKYRELGRNIEKIIGECDTLTGEIIRLERADGRIYALDDRRTRSDNSFMAVVIHPNYQGLVHPQATPESAKAWQAGRRFVVWAVDRERALDKINALLPPDKGFVISSIKKEEPP